MLAFCGQGMSFYKQKILGERIYTYYHIINLLLENCWSLEPSKHVKDSWSCLSYPSRSSHWFYAKICNNSWGSSVQAVSTPSPPALLSVQSSSQLGLEVVLLPTLLPSEISWVSACIHMNSPSNTDISMAGTWMIHHSQNDGNPRATLHETINNPEMEKKQSEFQSFSKAGGQEVKNVVCCNKVQTLVNSRISSRIGDLVFLHGHPEPIQTELAGALKI